MEGRAECVAKAHLGWNARQLRASPDTADRDVLADEREGGDCERHRLEADVVHEEVAADESDRRSEHAEVYLYRLHADALVARRRHLRQQRLVRPDYDRTEERERLDH